MLNRRCLGAVLELAASLAHDCFGISDDKREGTVRFDEKKAAAGKGGTSKSPLLEGMGTLFS